MCLYLLVYFLQHTLPSCILLDYSKSDNTHIVQMRRIHQNRRETHNLVNDLNLSILLFTRDIAIEIGVKSTSKW
ncbi:hypothetical protein HanRHA438_Chr08g0362901 [Helianthus annuus]|nr:hypothetical protein HanRHA438_Chr08g0362901 [Helianthus annuus]